MRPVGSEHQRFAAELRAERRYSTAEIARVLRERFPGVTARKAMRLARGWTQDQAAAEWTALFGEPKAAKQFSYWENWPQAGHAPSLDTLDQLAQLYECSAADLLADLPDHGHRRRGRSRAASVAGGPEGPSPGTVRVRPATPSDVEPTAPALGTALQVGSAGAAGSAGLDGTRMASEGDPRDEAFGQVECARDLLEASGVFPPVGRGSGDLIGRSPSRLDPSLVETHRQMEHVLATLYRGADPRAVMPFTATYADSLLSLLDQPMTDRQRSELSRIAAGLHAQVGLWACHMNRRHLAHRYLATSCDIARTTGDPYLYARTLGAFSYLFSSAPRGGTGGRPDLTVQMLDKALDLSRSADDFTRGWLATWRADQHATVGHLSQALADVEAADRWLDTNGGGQITGFFSSATYGCGMGGHLDSVRAVTLALAGETSDAERTFDHVCSTAHNMRRRIATDGHAALSYAATGQPEAACAALNGAVGAAIEDNYPMGLERALGVRARFDPSWSALPSVQDLDDQLRSISPAR